MFSLIDFATPEFDLALDLRYRVLRAPLGLDFDTHEIEQEYKQLHFGYWLQDQLVGYLQMVPTDNHIWKMRQVAVEPTLQGRGIGSQLVTSVEIYVKRLGCNVIVLHARKTAIPFYLRLGYAIDGTEFTEVGIPHLKMSKNL